MNEVVITRLGYPFPHVTWISFIILPPCFSKDQRSSENTNAFEQKCTPNSRKGTWDKLPGFGPISAIGVDDLGASSRNL